MTGGGQADVHPRVAQAPFDQGLRPGGDAERAQRLQFGRAGRPTHQLPLAQRAHQQDAQEVVEQIRHHVQAEKLAHGEVPRELTTEEAEEIRSFGAG